MRADADGSRRPAFPWLPAAARPVGLALTGAGALLGHAVLTRGFRPSFLDLPMFAVHARYFESKTFTVIEKNASLELATILLIVGLFGVAFSRDTIETAESERVRVCALLWAVCICTVLMLVATLTLFGLSFAYALATQAVLTLALASTIAALARMRRAITISRVRPVGPRGCT